VTDRQTDRLTDIATRSFEIGGIYLHSIQMVPYKYSSFSFSFTLMVLITLCMLENGRFDIFKNKSM